MSGSIRLAIDIGGTFTDLAAVHSETGELVFTKTSTTPRSLTDGVVSCLQRVGLPISSVDLFVHGSTVGINTIVERTGPPTSLITTEGFRDIYEMGRRNRPDIYDLLFHRPRPLVPRDRIYEVRERLDASGKALTPLETASIGSIFDAIAANGSVAVAVCLLHSYANPDHERQLGELLAQHLPGLKVSLSCDISREYREYERTSTAVINAYLQPVVGKYLEELSQRTTDLGFQGRTLVMQSSGGSMTLDAAARQPVRTIESGPAGGVGGVLWLCSKLGHDRAIAFDMGGTTAKACLILDGQATVTSDYFVGGKVEGHPAQVPFLDIIEIGAGGGSIAAVDSVGALKVGPRSAGAEPGPACYGQGGTEPTVTDANLVAGKLDPTRFLGGEMPLDKAAAETAMVSVGGRLSQTPREAANGILRLANAMMAQAVSKVSVQRGHDPRDFVMYAYGGAGPLHATAVARELGIGTVLIPPAPGQFSALGMLTTDIRYDYVQTYPVNVSTAQPQELDHSYQELEAEARAQLKADVGSDDVTFRRSADARYLGQFHTLAIPVPGEITGQSDLDELQRRFHEIHETTYGHSAPGEPMELISVRVAAFVATPEVGLPEIAVGEAEPVAEALAGSRDVLWEDGSESSCPVYQRELLLAGNVVTGPAIIEEAATTIPLGLGDVARIDKFGNIEVTVEVHR